MHKCPKCGQMTATISINEKYETLTCSECGYYRNKDIKTGICTFKPKTKIVMDALIAGIPIQFSFGEVHLIDGNMYRKVSIRSTKSNEVGEEYHSLDVSVMNFVRECTELSNEYCLDLCTTTALTKLQRCGGPSKILH